MGWIELDDSCHLFKSKIHYFFFLIVSHEDNEGLLNHHQEIRMDRQKKEKTDEKLKERQMEG